MNKLVLVVPFVAIVAACSGGAGGGAATMKAGQWEMTTKMTNVEVPGAPAAVAEQMKTAMTAAPQVQTQCLTQEQVGNMAQTLGQANGGGQSCNFTKTTFAGGTIDIAGTCQSPQGTVTMTQTGTFTADSMNVTTNADMNMAGQQVKITGSTEGRRTGDCPTK